MNRRFLCQLGLGLILAWTGAAPLQANPVKSPRRLVDGRMVDLNPLCRWWTNHSGTRPLGAWVHLTGAVVGTNAWGWIVEGQAERRAGRTEQETADKVKAAGSYKVLLLHPPLQDLVQFQQLHHQWKTLSETRAQLAAGEAQVKTRKQTVAQQQKAGSGNRLRSRALGQESKELSTLDNQAKSRLKLLDHQLQGLRNRLAQYPSPERYVLDCFALETGHEQNGISVYEHGSVFQY